MRVLTLDIETGPNLAHVWALFNQNIGLSQLQKAGEVMCFAAKWHDSEEIEYYSTFHDGKAEMLAEAYRLLEEADVVVHYNGVRFDIPHLNREFLEIGQTPPAPFQQVDLLRVVKKNFRFASNKLDFVVQTLGLGAKTQHTGHQLWVDCLAGDRDAWDLMREYNKQDVVVTEKLYDKLTPWISPVPSQGLYSGQEGACPACGGLDLRPRGYTYTTVSKYRRYRCQGCGKWTRGTERFGSTNVRAL